MAYWCVRTGFAPSEWKALTQAERQAIRTEHNTLAAEARNNRRG